MSGIVDDIRGGINDILGVRDSIGAALKPVYFVTRTWSGDELGDGTKSDTQIQMLPSPRIVQYLDDYRIKEGGAVQQGDIKLTTISKQSYPNREDVDCSSNVPTVEKFYKVGGTLYRVIGVRERHVTWEVQLRRISNQ